MNVTVHEVKTLLSVCHTTGLLTQLWAFPQTWEDFADTELHEDKSVDRVLFFSKSAKYGSQSSFQADMR